MSFFILSTVALAIALFVVFFLRNSVSSPPEGATDKDVTNLVKQGKSLQAIKWYRTLHGVSLKEAKEAVEKMKVS